MTGQPSTDVMDWTFEMILRVMLGSRCRHRCIARFSDIQRFLNHPGMRIMDSSSTYK